MDRRIGNMDMRRGWILVKTIKQIITTIPHICDKEDPWSHFSKLQSVGGRAQAFWQIDRNCVVWLPFLAGFETFGKNGPFPPFPKSCKYCCFDAKVHSLDTFCTDDIPGDGHLVCHLLWELGVLVGESQLHPPAPRCSWLETHWKLSIYSYKTRCWAMVSILLTKLSGGRNSIRKWDWC